MIAKRYTLEYKEIWDSFLSGCKNEHFIFYRNYMDYHKDRFHDHSLIIFDEKDRVIALFPANEDGDLIYSHQGLTFGGVLSDKTMTVSKMLEVFQVLINYYKKLGFTKINYKSIPYIYNKHPSEEDKYALFRCCAKLYRRDVTVTIDNNNPIEYQKLRKRMIKKAQKENVEVVISENLKDYWELLSRVLESGHNAKPVHSLKEIEFLQEFFPENIKCHAVYHEGEIVAGVLVYVNPKVAHCQYIAASDKGRKIGALDCLISQLITSDYPDKSFFDFGTSNENSGEFLNEGLIFQKEGFGARAVSHDFYEIIL